MYLDNAATSFPKPDSVCDAVNTWMRQGAAAGRGNHRGSEDAQRLLDSCRSQLARLLDVPSPSHVVFTFNCTDSLNTVLQGLLKPGDRVLASKLDHNSVLRPLQALREQRSVDYHLIDFEPSTGQIDVEEWQRQLTTRPCRLVVINHASNVIGTVQDVAELTRLAHDAGALVLLDAAQTAGHLPISMTELDVDFLAAAGHKGLSGPLGTGVLCVRKGLESQLNPLRYGGTGTASESLEQPQSMPHRFESGNLNLPGIAGLNAAVEWIQTQSVSAIHSSIRQHSLRLMQGLLDIPQVRVLSPISGCETGIVSFELINQDCREMAMILDQSFDIQCRAGLHCAPLVHERLGTLARGGTLRFSPGSFTRAEDIDTALRAVAEVASAV